MCDCALSNHHIILFWKCRELRSLIWIGPDRAYPLHFTLPQLLLLQLLCIIETGFGWRGWREDGMEWVSFLFLGPILWTMIIKFQPLILHNFFLDFDTATTEDRDSETRSTRMFEENSTGRLLIRALCG